VAQWFVCSPRPRMGAGSNLEWAKSFVNLTVVILVVCLVV
jgi:hypothetical protein